MMVERKLISTDKVSCGKKILGTFGEASVYKVDIIVKSYEDGESFPFGCDHAVDMRKDVEGSEYKPGVYCNPSDKETDHDLAKCKWYSKN